LKKILIFLLISTWQLSAWDKESTVKLYHHLFYEMTKHETIKLYTENKEYATIFNQAEHFLLVDKAEDADIILITSTHEIERLKDKTLAKHTILFTTRYRLLKSYDDIVGAFYWRKGRSQLLFIKERLESHDIKLPQNYSKFIIGQL